MVHQMRTIAAIVIVLVFYAGVNADDALSRIPVHPCFGNDMTANVLEVRVSNCKRLPCEFKQGSKVTIEFDFLPAQSITNDITTGATVDIGDINLPDLEPNESLACSSITSKQSGNPAGCELNAMEVYTYSKTTTVSKKFSLAGNVNLQWELYDDDNTIVCLNIPVRFEPPK